MTENPRRTVAVIAIAAALLGGCVGAAAAILIADPTQGPKGEEGPTGDRGARGTAGPKGPEGPSVDPADVSVDPEQVWEAIEGDTERLNQAVEVPEEEDPLARSLCDAMQVSDASIVSDVAFSGC